MERTPRQRSIIELGRKVLYIAEYLIMPTIEYHLQSRRLNRVIDEVARECAERKR